jgi:hypothetical protein
MLAGLRLVDAESGWPARASSTIDAGGLHIASIPIPSAQDSWRPSAPASLHSAASTCQPGSAARLTRTVGLMDLPAVLHQRSSLLSSW